MKRFVKKMLGRAIAVLSSEEIINISNSPATKLNIGLYGQCQLELLYQARGNTAHRLRHVLVGSGRHSEIPRPLDDDDCSVFAISSRVIIADALELPVPCADMACARLSLPEEAKMLIEKCEMLISEKVAAFQMQHGHIPVIYPSFFEPTFNAHGDLLDRYSQTSIGEIYRQLNMALSRIVSDYSNAYFLDTNAILNRIGRQYLQDDILLTNSHASFLSDWDYKLDSKRRGYFGQLAHAFVHEFAIHRYTSAFLAKISTIYSITRQLEPIKIIVCDLDDTLWRGVAADDDETDDHARIEGWPLGLVEALLYFKSRGGLLALCSKNDFEPTRVRFERIFKGAISFDDFVSIKVNWVPKSKNISEILSETNLLADSCLFIDDNPREIEEVKRVHPVIRTLGLDFYNWRKQVLMAAETQVPVITSESQNRTDLVRASAQRRSQTDSTQLSDSSREEWLKGLELRQTIYQVERGSRFYDRAFELLNKTNQFNTNGRRWTKQEFDHYLTHGGQCIVAGVKDKFTDNGIVSVLLYKENEITQMVLSCRVFGLSVETAVVSTAADLIFKTNKSVIGQIADTGKNGTCLDFYSKSGFKREGNRYVLYNNIPKPNHIKITVSNI